MDKRLKTPSNKEKIDNNLLSSDSFIETIDEDTEKLIIPADKIQASSTYMESMIYSLVHKLESIDQLNESYNQALAEIESYPKFIKYYVHVQYLVPVVIGTLAFLKYKKLLGVNSGCAIVCSAALLNEFVRYKKMKIINKEVAKQYDEYAANYDYLMRRYLAYNSWKNVFKYGFGINLDFNSINWFKYTNNDKYSKQFLQDMYF